MDNIRVVLASASPRREELLRQIGIIPEVIPSEIEEKVTEKRAGSGSNRAVEAKGRGGCREAWVKPMPKRLLSSARIPLSMQTERFWETGRMKPMRPECSDASGRPSHYVYTGVTLIAGNKKKLCSGNQGGRVPDVGKGNRKLHCLQRVGR